MKRISDESGESAGWRNWGRLMLSLIPAALGGAAVLWIIAGLGWIDLTKELRMERRTMQSVGISVLPKTPIQLLRMTEHASRFNHPTWMVTVFNFMLSTLAATGFSTRLSTIALRRTMARLWTATSGLSMGTGIWPQDT